MDPEDMDEEEAMRQALALNEELKRMAAEMEGRAHYESVQESYSTLPRASLKKPLPSAPKPVKRTFSSVPESLKFKRNTGRTDFTHTNGRTTDIARENQALANKLRNIDLNGGTLSRTTSAPRPLKGAPVSSSNINRRKKQSLIDIENARIHARLQSVKPTKSLAGSTLKKEHQRNQELAKNCSKVRVPRAKPEWNDRFTV